METVVVQMLKGITNIFRVGESHTIRASGAAVSLHHVQLGPETRSLAIRSSTYEASVLFPSSFASTVLLPGSTDVAVAIHVFQHAPIIGGVMPVTPLVGVKLLQSSHGVLLNVSNVPERINITLPLTTRVRDYQKLEYECMHWNGTGYSSAGCVATGVRTATTVQCACTHFATFIARVSCTRMFEFCAAPGLSTSGMSTAVHTCRVASTPACKDSVGSKESLALKNVHELAVFVFTLLLFH